MLDRSNMYCGPATNIYGEFIPNAIILVHDPEQCAGRHCVLHNPSNHHMRDWPTVFRGDTWLMERTCEHGIGHPDPDDLAWHVSEGRSDKGIHGCDGCCQPEKGVNQ